MDLNGYKLIIFDVDGTIADRDSDQLYPDAAAWFAQHGHQHYLALATNQGGVGLRHWMIEGEFGHPETYPDETAVQRRLGKLMTVVMVVCQTPSPHVCYAYQSKKTGQWSPAPEGREWEPEWNPENRKPAPGMLLQAMLDASVPPHETLMVGDGDEDKQAAINAGCAFIYADTFFDRVPNPAA